VRSTYRLGLRCRSSAGRRTKGVEKVEPGADRRTNVHAIPTAAASAEGDLHFDKQLRGEVTMSAKRPLLKGLFGSIVDLKSMIIKSAQR
jgi:hypothetical protein